MVVIRLAKIMRRSSVGLSCCRSSTISFRQSLAGKHWCRRSRFRCFILGELTSGNQQIDMTNAKCLCEGAPLFCFWKKEATVFNGANHGFRQPRSVSELGHSHVARFSRFTDKMGQVTMTSCGRPILLVVRADSPLARLLSACRRCPVAGYWWRRRTDQSTQAVQQSVVEDRLCQRARASATSRAHHG